MTNRNAPDDRESESVVEHLRAAREILVEVRTIALDARAQQMVAMMDRLREVEIQVGCAAALLQQKQGEDHAEAIAELKHLRKQLDSLSSLFDESSRFISGWLGRLLTHRNGYTRSGEVAHLSLVNRTAVEG